MVRLRPASLPHLLLRVTATVCIVGACDSPTGPSEPDPQPIVFFRLDNGWELFTVNPRGGAPRRLTLPMRETLFPALSPDGSQLAFVVESDPEGVYVGAADGSGARLVYPRRTDRITWSPDGTRLALAFDGEIIVIPLAGGSPQTITGAVDVHASYPSWSSTGRIAFHTYGGCCVDSDIYTIAENGSDLRLVVSGEGMEARDPAWSPDGSRLAFALGRFGESYIVTSDANGNDPRRVTPAPDNEYGWTDLGPEWAPSGQWIAHQRQHAVCIFGACESRYDILVVRPDGSDVRNLTIGSAWGGVRPSW